MAHFAELDADNVVVRVLVVPDEHEHRGKEYLSDDLGLGGTWVQTSYNNRIRKHFAGIGFTYDEGADVFVSPQPFPSWSLDENFDWQAPVAKPTLGTWEWNEDAQEWRGPFPSWTLNDNGEWEPPLAPPPGDGPWRWDEDTLAWVEVVSGI